MSDDRMSMRHTQSRAALARDAALDRISRTRRWVIAGSALLTAGFAALVSAVAPGRSLASNSQPRTEASTATASTGSTSSSRAGSSAIPQMPPPADPSTLGLQGPNQAPSPAPQDSQPQSTPSQPQSAPSQPQPQSAPTPAPAAPAPPVVSGGS